MTDFDFNPIQVNARWQEQMDGCRDWVAQAVTRFYLLGLVTLCGQELSKTPALYDGRPVTYLNFNRTIPNRADFIQPAPFWFPDIIDKKFVMTPTRQNPTGVTIQSIPMWCGKFYDPNLTRLEMLNVYSNDMTEHYTFRYNYNALPRPESAGSTSGGPPPPQPPPGGRGSSDSSSSSSKTGSRPKKATVDPSSSNNAGSQPSDPGARSGQSSRTPSGGNPQSGEASTSVKKHSWVPVIVRGQDKGLRDQNARPDRNGLVPVYTNSKQENSIQRRSNTSPSHLELIHRGTYVSGM